MRSKSVFYSGVATAALLAIGVASIPVPASAYTLIKKDSWELDANLSLWAAAFDSEHNYDIFFPGYMPDSKSDWQEFALGYGLSGYHDAFGGQIYGAASLKTTATTGQGDAAGFTLGTERRTAIDDLYLGWRSGDAIPILGHNGLDVSFGSQNVSLGNGFLLQGDALNFGKGLGGEFDRGGAYWLANRGNFSRTAVIKIGGDKGWHGALMYLDSHNKGQAKTKIGVVNLDNTSKYGTAGLTYIQVTDVNAALASDLGLNRDHMKVYDAHFQGNAGVPDLFLSAEYAYEDKHNADNPYAWYLQAGWTFSSLPLSPHISYRFSRFSPGYDTLFYGVGTEGLGTWFQGEVAGNYAGPFNTNARVNTIFLTATVNKQTTVTLSLWQFDTLDKSAGLNEDGHEADLFAMWSPSPHLTLIPLVAVYKPSVSAANGGTQIGGNDTSLYGMLLAIVNF